MKHVQQLSSLGTHYVVIPCHACDTDDTSEQAWIFTGHAISHEATVRMAHKEDLLVINVEFALCLPDQILDICCIIITLPGNVAAGIVAIPEVLTSCVLDPTRIKVNEPIVACCLS